MYPFKFLNKNNLIKILKLASVSIFIILVFTIIFMNYDHSHFNGFSKENDMENKFFNRLYFTTTTFSSTGYGDVSPKSNDVKIISIILQFSLVIILLSGTFEI